MTLVDTHCHLNFEQFDTDLDRVLESARQHTVTRFIIPAVDIETCVQAITVAEKYAEVFVAVGVHPNSSKDFTADTLVQLREFAKHPKVIAIGEIGLDYHWDFSPKEAQFHAFKMQLALAKELELPVIIHNREASDDVLTILEEWAQDLPDSLKTRAGVLHSFSGDESIAQRTLAIGFYVGFSGPITYKKSDELRQIARKAPSDRILVETDAPYLTPEPHRGKRNTPEYIPLIVDRLASIRNTTPEEIGNTTTENALRLFNIP